MLERGEKAEEVETEAEREEDALRLTQEKVRCTQNQRKEQGWALKKQEGGNHPVVRLAQSLGLTSSMLSDAAQAQEASPHPLLSPPL